ncbi:hypothetical protein PTTG_25296 [Puccinia triticina 1-1 BBBD Race 1]|uniref:Polysaccharide lyase 14 domain-containing protein n=1 Tax=Puccinia triticina (isolate 1-1 / race 1 (BBBD)) TaxID=630390 RepID=A0A180H453_PUCT1|nr:hypothetical protein PTTG_25296 [Puccinia triticina 1-1 BBBD Race 1]WAR53141.1 hypothetical protein PtB15_2B572 [Puccinia triticina]
MKTYSFEDHAFQPTRRSYLCVLYALLIQLGSINTSSIQPSEPSILDEPQILPLQSTKAEDRWRMPANFTLDDLRPIIPVNSSSMLRENFLVVSRNTEVPERLFIPEEFEFFSIQLPGIYGGTTFGEKNFKPLDGFHAHVMIQEDGMVGFYTQNPQSNQHGSLSCAKLNKFDCDSSDAKVFSGESRRLSRGIWTTIRQDVWLDDSENSIGGFNLWINDNFLSGQSNISSGHLVSIGDTDLTQATHIKDEQYGRSVIENVVEEQVSPPSEQRTMDSGKFTPVVRDDRSDREPLQAIENSRSLEANTRKSSASNSQILQGQETTIKQNLTQQIARLNLTGIIADSHNSSRVNETKNSTNEITVDHRYFGAFPALGIPALAELAKKNAAKVVPTTPTSTVIQPFSDPDTDDDENENEGDSSASSTGAVTSSPNSEAKLNPLNPLLGALGSILLEQEAGPLQSNKPDHLQPLHFSGFYANHHLSSAPQLDPQNSNSDVLIFFYDFQIIIQPILNRLS